MKIKFITVLLLSFTLYLNAQNDTNLFWDAVLKNDRNTALNIIQKNNQTDVEWLLLEEILRVERGKTTTRDEFLDSFLKHKDFEYYLYAFWNSPFIFDSYLEDGFDSIKFKKIEKVSKSNINNKVIRDALSYINSIKKRRLKDWKGYYEINKTINTIKDWQYCGPFENLNESGLDRVYEPETISKSSLPFDAGSNGKLNWYTSNSSKEAYQFFSNHSEYGSGVHYAQTFIDSKEKQDVIFRIGSGSAFHVFLNDVLIYKNTEDVTTDLNAYNFKVTLPLGNNRLLIKTAESNSTSYFIINVTDINKLPLENISVSSKPSTYNKSTLLELNPRVLENEFETFFKQKIKENPNNFFYTYCLFKTYIRNSKHSEAKELITPIHKEYPKSSLLRKLLISVYTLEGDRTTLKEIKENIEQDDPDYYLPMLKKMLDTDELSRMSDEDFEIFAKKFKNTFDNKALVTAVDFLTNAKKQNMSALKQNLDQLLKETDDNGNLLMEFAPLYDQLFQESDITIKLLEKQVSNYTNYQAVRMLAEYYEQNNKKEEAIKIMSEDYEFLINDNYYIKNLVRKLFDYQMYEEALPYLHQSLENYPYSFVALELKGDVLKQLEREDEALEYYTKSLKHNSANSSLREKINNLKGNVDTFEQLVLEDAYDYIKQERGKIKNNNYGFNILLDDGNIEIFEEGGGKFRYVFVYEITSNSGIDSFKEYNLGLSGQYKVIKSELVKLDSRIVPADRSGSNLVFNDISIGDVVYIDYEGSFSSTGRFYKDLADKFQFDSFHPTVKSSLDIMVPDNRNINYKYVNGSLEPSVKKGDGFSVYTWEVNSPKTLPYAEDYMPNSEDILGYLHISTIDSWNDISSWYSDLVRSRIEINATVKDAFKSIFANGYKQLSEDDKAMRIYNYIRDNFNYSSVSFRQSGYVPQKPSKTILTALGDCKDFSTLFVTLAKMAELDSNLVLILTSDYGQKNMILPSTQFNHCIVKVYIDGKPQFLELTNKYLPYKSLPTSLINATALEIPYNQNVSKTKYELFKLKDVNREKAALVYNVTANISSEKTELDILSKITGQSTSYYTEIFAEPNSDIVKKYLLEDYQSRIFDDFTLNSYSDVNKIEKGKIIEFKSNITINKKLNKIGSINVLELPIITHPYESSIIKLENRNYPIDYLQYEAVDSYEVVYTFNIDESMSFIEVPENKSLKFKNHSYDITYNLKNKNELQVVIKAKPSFETINPDEYSDYKAYVKAVLDIQSEFIGFK